MNIHVPKIGVLKTVAVLSFLAASVCQATSPAPGAEFSDCEDCPTMVAIPHGKFLMGSDEGEEGRPEGPIHEVRIDHDFAAGKYEVTFAQFSQFVRESGHSPAENCVIWTDKWEPLDDTSWRNPGHGRPPLENEPVSCISWYDAKAYAAWLTDKTKKPYRLLTEAEWEYVARAGTTTRFYWGDTAEGICQHVNLFDDSGRKTSNLVYVPAECDDGFPFTAPVGSFKPNPFGLYDVLGNVWEWTEDCFAVPYPPGLTGNESYQVEGECEKRSIRGGSWITTPSRLRAAFRGRDPAAVVFTPFGFRVARDLD